MTEIISDNGKFDTDYVDPQFDDKAYEFYVRSRDRMCINNSKVAITTNKYNCINCLTADQLLYLNLLNYNNLYNCKCIRRCYNDIRLYKQLYFNLDKKIKHMMLKRATDTMYMSNANKYVRNKIINYRYEYIETILDSVYNTLISDVIIHKLKKVETFPQFKSLMHK